MSPEANKPQDYIVNKLPQKIIDRRYRTLGVLEKIHALQSHVETTPEGLSRFEDHLSQGKPGSILFTHPDFLDPIRLQVAYMQSSEVVAERGLVVPTAHHQNFWFLEKMASAEGVALPSVVTPHTTDRGKNHLRPTQRVDLWMELTEARLRSHFGSEEKLEELERQWDMRDSLPKGWGAGEYLEMVTAAYKDGRIPAISPQSGRSKMLGNPGSVMGMLFRRVKEVNMDEVAFSFVAVDPGPPKEQSKVGHMINNVFGNWKIVIGDTMTGAQIREEAKARKVSLDTIVFDQFAKIVPAWYLGHAEVDGAASTVV